MQHGRYEMTAGTHKMTEGTHKMTEGTHEMTAGTHENGQFVYYPGLKWAFYPCFLGAWYKKTHISCSTRQEINPEPLSMEEFNLYLSCIELIWFAIHDQMA